MHVVVRLLVAGAATLAAACASLSGGARSEFASSYACPPERVQVAERPDLKPHPAAAPAKPVVPIGDVQNDPERLAYYREQARKQQEEVTAQADSDPRSVFEVSGCGHRGFYACKHPMTSEGPSPYDADCAPYDPDAGPGTVDGKQTAPHP